MVLLHALVFLSISFQEPVYFPLKPGTTWEYHVIVGDKEFGIQKHVVRPPLEIQGKKVFPMDVIVNGQVDNVVYYAIEGDFITVAAVEEKKLLPKSIPVLPLKPTAGLTWEYQGEMPLAGFYSMSTTKTKIIGFEEAFVLNKKQRVLRVDSDTEYQVGREKVHVHSTEHYLSGVGLTYRKLEVKGKPKQTTIMELVRYSENEK
ncbi:MAG TPA: hypothetical protein VNK96_03040 [Fimbriimonadales bacterium]|nr:hypothetical protein [Fimbriimonadales bacterium]